MASSYANGQPATYYTMPVVSPVVIEPPQRYKRGMAGQGPYVFPDNEVFNDDQAPVGPPFQFCFTKKALFYDLSKNLTLEAKARHKIVRLSSTAPKTMPVAITIKTVDLTASQLENREPMDLICVVDVSGSMMGEKLNLLKKTLTGLSKFLKKRDRLCLIQFNTNAKRLTPLMRCDKQGWKIFNKVIEGLEADGQNTIPGGMDLAFKVINERKQANPITSVFLLSDGIEDGADEEVRKRMQFRNMEGVNFTINTFGFGRDHDENLLTSISKRKRGEFYFINWLYSIDECFAAAFAGLSSVVAKEVVVNVRNVTTGPLAGVTIKKTYGDAWTRVNDREYSISIPFLFSGKTLGFVCELEIPPISVNVPDDARNIKMLDINLAARDAPGIRGFFSLTQLVIRVVNEKGQIGDIEEDADMMSHYYRVIGGQAVAEAIDMGTRGDYSGGAARISYAMNQIPTTAYHHSLRQEMTEAKQSLAPQQFLVDGRKIMVQKVQNCMNQQVNLKTMEGANRAIQTTVETVRANRG